uniref:Uncharacterized protein n=1 Tax=Aegilops tauschii subsp. strangulata TaxID=200361 RepID=A0A453AAQ6_AEGTS
SRSPRPRNAQLRLPRLTGLLPPLPSSRPSPAGERRRRAMRPCSRVLVARHLLRGSRFQLPAALRRPGGTDGPPAPTPPHLGGFGPGCRVSPGTGGRAPLGPLYCLLPGSAFPPRRCAWPLRDLVTSCGPPHPNFFSSTLRCADIRFIDNYTVSMFY